MLEAGHPAPTFSLPDADMETVRLADFKGRKHVVLYFYPKDGTPACTMQAIDFSDHEEHFAEADCVVIGVSCDDCITHAEFRDENGLSVTLLADTGRRRLPRLRRVARSAEQRRQAQLHPAVHVRHRQARQGAARALRRQPEEPRGRGARPGEGAQLMRAS